MIGQHDEEQRKRHVAVVHGALLGLFPQREICRSSRARRGQHLVLSGKNPHPDIRDHDRAEQGPDVHERRAPGEQAAEQHRDGGEQRERDSRRHDGAARQGRTPQRIIHHPAHGQQADAQHDRGAAANAGNAWIEQIGIAQSLVDRITLGGFNAARTGRAQRFFHSDEIVQVSGGSARFPPLPPPLQAPLPHLSQS